MSLDLTLRLVEQVTPIAAGTSVSVPIDGPEDLALVQRWVDTTGNTILMVHPESVEVFRGRIRDPIEALSPDRRPGFRLWIYTNFHCNLACDYCCVSSSPSADRRVLPAATVARLAGEAAALGTCEIFLTGGEPFLRSDIAELVACCAAAAPTIVLTNGMLFRGARLGWLDACPREGVTLQISVDSASSALHDRHRGLGSHAAALEGIRTALDHGFTVRVAATLGPSDHGEEAGLHQLCDGLGLGADDRVIRRIARQGNAGNGVRISRASIIPELCVTDQGVWWHPVGANDPDLVVSHGIPPLSEAVAAVTAEFREHRLRNDEIAAAFPCG